MNRMTLLAAAIAAVVALAGPDPARAQNFVLEFPEASQQASVSQRIGLTDITISYHRPGVNGRKVWGDLVPYNEVWRAGANDNTVIAFSTDVLIGGQSLPAGRYGLHMIPTEGSWTVIFSKVSDAWGSFSYDPKEDALRVTVTPAAAPMEERLSYRMDDPGANSVTVSLYWDKLRVPFVVEADVKEIVFRDLRDRQLRGMPRFFWQGWNQAAAWCLNNNVHLDDALAWSDQSIGINPTFNNLNVKAGLLEKKGDMAGAQELREKALGMAGEQDINLYAYQLLGQGKNDEAIRYFEKNTKDYPQSWNTWDSLAEAYATVGRKDDAVTNYRKALDMTGSQDQKKRIEAAIAKLE